MNIIRVVAGMGVMLFASCAWAKNTWHVDAAHEGMGGLDGASWETAYARIQDAIDAPTTQAGDEILVKPGVYDKGASVDALGSSNRVHVTKKLAIRSSTGVRDSVVVVGAWATGDGVQNGVGDNAIRCVGVAQDASGTTLQGFVLRDGGTPAGDNSCKVSGGGIVYLHASSSPSADIVLVDSTVENCVATRGGGARGVVLVRCLIRGCSYYNYSGSTGGSAMRQCSAYNCIFRNNGGTSLDYPGTVVNCTFDNSQRYYYDGFVANGSGNDIFNCVLLPSRNVGSAKYHSCITTAAELTTDDGSNVLGAKEVLAGPAVGDCRLLAASEAVDRGDVSALAKIPEAYRDADFFGNPRTTSNGTKVSIGAVEVKVTPVAAKLVIQGASYNSTRYSAMIDGNPIWSGYVYPTQWPTQYLVGVESYPDNCGLVRFNHKLDGTDSRACTPPSLKDDTIWAMPHPTQIRELAPLFAPIRWVDAANEGKPGLDGLAEATAFARIQDAVEANRVVKVKPGVYDKGETYAEGMSNRLAVTVENIRIVSTGGAAMTVIKGAADPDDAKGVGSAAVRTVVMTKASTLQGFTLTGSHPDKEVSATYRAAFDGGAGSTRGGMLADSVVSNNFGIVAGLYNAYAVRTLFTDNAHTNTSDSCVLRSVTVANCLFLDNRTARLSHNSVSAYSSTFVERVLLGTTFFAGYQAKYYNNIFSIGRDVSQTTTINDMGGCIFDGCKYTKGNQSTFVYADPMYAWKEAGDFRLMPGSCAWRQGVTTFDDYSNFAASDFNGNPLTITDGHPVVGAFSAPLPQTSVFVAMDGDDGNDGLSADRPKATLAAALSVASPLDTVKVAPGTYGTGTMIHLYGLVSKGQTPTVRARAVVPPHVTLESTGSAVDTAIVGAAATSPDSDGCGADAVRCVVLHANAMIRGFTIRDGRTNNQSATSDDNAGAGILCESAKSVAEDCVISGNHSVRGGGALYGTYRRCVFADNKATSNGSAARQAALYGCAVGGNRGVNDCSFMSFVSGCTFTHSSSGSSTAASLSGESALAVSNCLFVTENPFSWAKIRLVRCAFVAGHGQQLETEPVDCVIVDSTDRLQVDSAWRPLLGANAAIDSGMLEDWTALGFGATDAFGAQRVFNGQMDIGCYEADWRPAYSKILGRKGCLTVKEADAAARAEGVAPTEVWLPTGQMTGTLALSSAGTCTFPVRVTGTGKLTVSLDGVQTAAYVGAGMYAFRPNIEDTASHEIAFAYEPGLGDAGGAYIGRGGRDTGLIMIFR